MLVALAGATLLRSATYDRSGCRGEADEGYERGVADGYLYVGCLRDAQAAPASAIYADAVEREKRVPITPRVCFDFCRTMPGMQFFALTQGRTCYCAPFYKRAPGEGVCSLGCDGNHHFTCGGDGMMDMYAMHACHDAESKLTEALETAEATLSTTNTDAGLAATLAEAMLVTADAMYTIAVNGGDADTTSYCQEAREFSGELKHAGEAASQASGLLRERVTAARAITGDFAAREVMYDAELAQREMRDLGKQAKDAGDALRPLLEAASRGADAWDETAARLFIPVATAVELWSTLDPSASAAPRGETVCAGELIADPVVGVTKTECAEACEDMSIRGDECVAFQYYKMEKAPSPAAQFPSLCMLLGTVELARTFECPMECKHTAWTDRRGYGCDWYGSFGPSVCSTSGTHEGETAATACCMCSENDGGKGAQATAGCMVRFEWAHAKKFSPEMPTHQKCYGDA